VTNRDFNYAGIEVSVTLEIRKRRCKAHQI